MAAPELALAYHQAPPVGFETNEVLRPAELVERYIAGKPPTQGQLEGLLADAPDGVYISPNIMARTGNVLPELVEVELLPGAQLGAADSHHGVVFGRVAVKVGDNAAVVKVAFKEFTTESERAIQEHDVLLAAHQRGFETFVPLAVARDGERTYLITEKRDEVTSMDNEDWSLSPRDAQRYSEIAVPNLHYIADAVAQLHAKGIFHGDAQPKNIARTDVGKFVVIDVEDGRVASDEGQLVEMMTGGWEPRDSKALEDMWHCWYAMTHPLNGENPDSTVKSVVFLQDEDYETCMREFESNFLNPYIQALKKHADPKLLARFNLDELRTNLYDRVARTT
jgi:hypothetical protein